MARPPTLAANPSRLFGRYRLLSQLRVILRAHHGHYSQARPELLALTKENYLKARSQIAQEFQASHDGMACVAAQSLLHDQLLRVLYDLAQDDLYPAPNPTPGQMISLVALGGFGRGELAPFSDLDILFLYQHDRSERVEQISETMLYFLWDLGLKIGQSCRNIAETLAAAKQDVTVMTSLTEMRYLCGNRQSYQALRLQVFKELQGPSRLNFTNAKIKERDDRHNRLGLSRYLLEPNLKEGKGALRDLHLLRWLAVAAFGETNFQSLAKKAIISRDDAAEFQAAHQFLLALRCHLHYLSERAEERMSFAAQPDMAALLGYTHHAGASAVERLMKHYFLNARKVGQILRRFMGLLEAKQDASHWVSRVRPMLGLGKKQVHGFSVEAGRVSLSDEQQLARDPLAALRIFQYCAETGFELHPTSWDWLSRHQRKITPALRQNPAANALFVAIVLAPKGAELALRQMSETGILGRFIPDFARIVAQMQFDMYHVYTTDEHTIRAIGILHAIEQGEHYDDHPLATRLMPRIANRRVLYIALFLHDIAKGRGGDHSILGEDVANQLGPRLGLSPEETKEVAWLVRNHLLMSKVATKRDLSDAKTISDFVALVQTPEMLRMLLCLTVADIRAVGPVSWNHWKASLLRELYDRAEAAMQGDSDRESTLRASGHAKRQALAEALKAEGWQPEAIHHHLEQSRDNYLSQHDLDELITHAKLVAEVKANDGALAVMIRRDRVVRVREVTICCLDHPGLIARLAGAFALVKMHVVAAKITTLPNGLAVDSFLLDGLADDKIVQDSDEQRLKQTLDKALKGAVDLPKQIEALMKQPLGTKPLAMQITPKVVIDNEASRTRTVIEVTGGDRLGLLYHLTRTLAAQNLQIITARISTYGEKAVDVFYVRDRFGHKITNLAHLETIKLELLKQLL